MRVEMKKKKMIRYIIFFFKQKTAYEMRISDWSSDVCSSDLSQISPPATEKCPEQADDHSTRAHSDPRHSAGPDSGTNNGFDGAMGMVRTGGGAASSRNVGAATVRASAVSVGWGLAANNDAWRQPGAAGAGGGGGRRSGKGAGEGK